MTLRLRSVAQVVTGIAAALAILYYLRGIVVPFVIAFVLVVLVDALITSIRRRWPRAPTWLVSGLAALVVIVAVGAGIFVLGQGAVGVVEQGPALVDRLDVLVQEAGRSLRLQEPLHVKLIVGDVTTQQVVGFILAGVHGLGGTAFLVIVFFGFLLAGRHRLWRKFDRIAGSSRSVGLPNTLIARIAADIRTYLWVQTVTGAMKTAVATSVMLAVGLDNALFWTAIFFLLTFIPSIGVTVGSIAPALFALLQFPSTGQAIAIFGVIQLAAFIVGNFIYPRIQADMQNIDPVATILSLAFWTTLWGIPGAFLAVPLTLILMMIFAQFDSTRWIATLLSNDGQPDFRNAA